MTRALLLFNPEATTVTPRVRDVIAHALDDVVSLEVEQTKRRDHATEIARDAVAQGVELVFCLGGDGTFNETLNGLAGSEVTLAVLPGGGTNVYARSLGLPRDPVEATAVFIERLKDGVAPRRVNLGTMNGRRFAFCAGVGFDAEVVRRVHDNFAKKQRIGDGFFVSSAVKQYFFKTKRRSPALTLDLLDGQVVEALHLLIAGKSDPYTFLGTRPFRLTPNASVMGGIDVFSMRSMSLRRVLSTIARGFASARHDRVRYVHTEHDLRHFIVRASRPVAVQLDGEDLGDVTTMEFGVEPNALSVLS